MSSIYPFDFFFKNSLFLPNCPGVKTWHEMSLEPPNMINSHTLDLLFLNYYFFIQLEVTLVMILGFQIVIISNVKLKVLVSCCELGRFSCLWNEIYKVKFKKNLKTNKSF